MQLLVASLALYFNIGCKQVAIANIAIKALKIFESYAKKHQTFSKAEDEFNNKLNIVEKRAVVVALFKLGIPIYQPIGNGFEINDIKFKEEPIDRDAINIMQQQVKSGNCDTFFFSDVDQFFATNTRLTAVRDIALRYVDNVMAKSKYSEEAPRWDANNPDLSMFSVGELNTVEVFAQVINNKAYYDKNENVATEKLAKLKKEINLGLWDTYLFWGPESYRNQKNNNQMLEFFKNAFQNTPKAETNTKIGNS